IQVVEPGGRLLRAGWGCPDFAVGGDALLGPAQVRNVRLALRICTHLNEQGSWSRGGSRNVVFLVGANRLGDYRDIGRPGYARQLHLGQDIELGIVNRDLVGCGVWRENERDRSALL